METIKTALYAAFVYSRWGLLLAAFFALGVCACISWIFVGIGITTPVAW